MPDQVQASFRDFDGTRQTTGIAVDTGATPTERLAIFDEIVKWSAGSPDGHTDQNVITAPDGGASSNPVAQEAVQGIMEMKDAVTGQIYRERIPQAATDKADDGGADPAWTTEGQGANSLTVANQDHDDYVALAVAMDAAWESPNGNAGTLEKLYIEK